MPYYITDSANNPITSVALSQAESTDSGILVGSIPARAGYWLTAAATSDAYALARRTGSGDAFVNLSLFPIDLTPYAGTSVSFDFKLHSNTVTGNVSTAVQVLVTPTP